MVLAVVVESPGAPPQLREVELPRVTDGMARVQIAAAGICHSDLSLVNGTLSPEFPVIPGHEAAGIVVETGAGIEVPVGTHVVINWAPPCRTCWFCQHRQPWLCTAVEGVVSPDVGVTSNGAPVRSGFGVGAYAEEVVVPARSLVPVPDELPFETAAVLGCAVLTGVGSALNSAAVAAGESVVVIGLGGIGLSAILGARLAGADPVIAVDVAPDKEKLARQAGATHFLDGTGSVSRQVRELTGGRGADHAFECVGRAGTIRTAWGSTRRGGCCTVVGVGGRDQVVEFNALELFHFARVLTSSIYGNSDPERDIPRLVKHLADGTLDLTPLITGQVRPDTVADAFARMERGEGARSILTFDRG
jgi:S-(hydroxymethyl)glutathione dehydrogenase / alcohol dehydrogenase